MPELSKVEELMKKGLAFRESTWYYYMDEGKKVPLGRTLDEANKKLLSLAANGIQSPEPLEKPAEQILEKEVIQPKEIIAESPGPDKTEPGVDDFSDILSTISDIKPDTMDYLAILYKGCHISQETDEKGNLTVVGKLPIVFRWRKRGVDKDGNNSHVIDDGNGNFTCHNWTVFMKDKSEANQRLYKDLTFMRNDTPNGQFVTNGDLILCVAKKEQYQNSQRQKALRGMISVIKDKERRIEIGRNVGKHQDQDKALKYLENANSSDTELAKKHEMDFDVLKTLV